MKRWQLAIGLLLFNITAEAQPVRSKLETAVQKLMADSQSRHAILGLYVVKTATGEPVYSMNEQIGLAPASCQKIFTSIASMDLLGHDYTFKTRLGYDGAINNGTLNGNLFITGYGDPSLGSWRYKDTKDTVVMNRWVSEISNAGISKIDGDIIFDNLNFSYQPIPGGWIWDDIGNYYGAGHWGLNWHENQYDLFMKPGDIEGEDAYPDRSTEPEISASLSTLVKTGKKGSGDNAYIYLPPYSNRGFVEGTIPAGVNEFHISGSLPDPSMTLGNALDKVLSQNKIRSGRKLTIYKEYPMGYGIRNSTTFYMHLSPPLDSINYYFLKRSINLYGEALLRTIAYEKTGFGNTDSGVAIIRRFWQERGIERSALHILDGSGLSPQNRVTAHSLVTALQYARTKPWFASFYYDLPEFNRMKLKSGSIAGARSFAGYHTSKDGTEYTVAIIINNFDGSSSSIVNKMFAVLDELK